MLLPSFLFGSRSEWHLHGDLRAEHFAQREAVVVCVVHRPADMAPEEVHVRQREIDDEMHGVCRASFGVEQWECHAIDRMARGGCEVKPHVPVYVFPSCLAAGLGGRGRPAFYLRASARGVTLSGDPIRFL